MCIYLQIYPQLIPFFQNVSEINLLILKHSRADVGTISLLCIAVHFGIPEGKQKGILMHVVERNSNLHI